MPELPEVETTCRGIRPHIVGHRIAGVRIRNRALRWPVPEDLPQLLEGLRIHNVRRRAKYILIDIDGGTLIVHLGMSGSLRIVEPDTAVRKHDHIDVVLDDDRALRLHDPRRFGAMLWTTNETTHALLKDLGPEPWESTADLLFTRSRGRRQSIKGFIMDSHTLVGIGNIYASEALFIAGVRPTRAAGRVSRAQFERLREAMVSVIDEAIKVGGTTLRDFVSASGEPGYFRQRLRVYERAGEPCRVCSTPIKRVLLTGRASYYCPQCQR
jgi:formamidopyrimidine-DNA glycosylase